MSSVATSPSSEGLSFEEPHTLDVLPPELLSYIFTFAWHKRRFAHRVPCEVQLSHVSRKWRAVALSTSVLWTKISIYSPDSFKWVPAYLQRSGSCLPLSLLIDVYRWDKSRRINDMGSRLTFASSVHTQLGPHVERIYNLSIMSYHEFTAIPFQTVFGSALAPNLEAINVQFDHSLITAPIDMTPPKIFTGGTPMLTFIDTPFIAYLNKSNLRHLTTLFITLTETLPVTYPEFAEILTTPTSLYHLSITGSSNHLLASWPFHRLDSDPNLRLANLKSLRIIGGSMIAVKLLLSVSTPKLDSIWLNCSFDNFHNVFDAQQFLPQASGGGPSKFDTLKYLTTPECNLVWVIKLSETFPNVTHFHLPHVNFHHGNLLVSALKNWKSMQALVFTQARHTRWESFSIALEAALEERKSTKHPIKSLIMDRDFRTMLVEKIPHLSSLVDVVDLSPESYREPWWNKQIRNPFEAELT